MLRQVLVYALLLVVPVGVLITIAWVMRKRSQRGPTTAQLDPKKRCAVVTAANSPALLLGVFPLFLLLYQLAHEPNANPLLFTAGYVFFSAVLGTTIGVGYLMILDGPMVVSDVSGADAFLAMALTVTGLTSSSLYVAWMTAALTDLLGNAWRGNVLWANIIDGLFGLLVGALCVFLVRLFRRSRRSAGLFLTFLVAMATSIAWIVFCAKAGMPLYTHLADIVRTPRHYVVRDDDLIMQGTFFVEAVMIQIVIPLSLVSFFVRSLASGEGASK